MRCGDSDSAPIAVSGVAAAAAALAAVHKADAPGEGAAAQQCALQENGELGHTDGDEEEGERLPVMNMTQQKSCRC